MTMPSSLRGGDPPNGGDGVPERQEPPLLEPTGEAEDLPPHVGPPES